MQRYIVRLSAIVILLSLFLIPVPALATAGNTLEICTSQGSTPYVNQTFTLYGAYGTFYHYSTTSQPDNCTYVGGEENLPAGTFVTSEKILSGWSPYIACMKIGDASWTFDENTQVITVTFPSTGNWAQCTFLNYSY